MSIPQPYILEDCTLRKFVQYVIENHTATSWCIICSSREAFMARLERSSHPRPSSTERQSTGDSDDALEGLLRSRLSMRLLASCRTMRVAFVSDIAHLRAFLGSLTTTSSATDESENQGQQPQRSIIAILDLILLHAPTTSYSAQGFMRTFALAVEAASAQKSALILCETSSEPVDPDAQHPPPTNDGLESPAAVVSVSSPWDDDIGIVDIRTKTFGPGSRGWVGRTVKIRSIAERWLTFKKTDV